MWSNWRHRIATSSAEPSPDGQAAGPDPKRGDYESYATFEDPDGNSWLVQEVPSRGSAV